MKPLLLLPLIFALPAFAGSTASVMTTQPAQASCLTSWFAGGSVGYLTELEEPMYNVHLGVTNNCWSLGGFNVSLFAEVGYAQRDEDFNGNREEYNHNFDPDGGINLDDLEDFLDGLPGDSSYDFTIVPITLNVKFDRVLTGNLSAYIGAGVGVAWTELEIDTDMGDESDDDWVFTGQVFAGLNYAFTPNFDVYGGARWIYLDDAEMGVGELDLDDDWLFELGARFKF